MSTRAISASQCSSHLKKLVSRYYVVESQTARSPPSPQHQEEHTILLLLPARRCFTSQNNKSIRMGSSRSLMYLLSGLIIWCVAFNTTPVFWRYYDSAYSGGVPGAAAPEDFLLPLEPKRIVPPPLLSVPPATTTRNDAELYPFLFSACLLVKDDNILLPEWLAYHYTVLPLRHLIVAVDPLSRTVPFEIFDRYREIGMNITVWTGHSYWTDGKWFHEKFVNFDPLNYTHVHRHNMHRNRQRVFLRACMQEHKKMNRTWTLLVDTDEYINYNHWMDHEASNAATSCSDVIGPQDFFCQNALDIQKGTHVRNKLPSLIGRPNETLAYWIASGHDPAFDNNKSGCIVYPRITYSSHNSSNPVIDQSVPEGVDPLGLHTVQFIKFSIHKELPGKPLINLSQLRHIPPVRNPHKPFTAALCRNGPIAGLVDHSFRVQHYTGGYDVWSSRIGRSKKAFSSRNRYKIQEEEDTGMQLWFHEFVKLVGSIPKANKLTIELRQKALEESRELVARWERNETVLPYKAWDEW